MLGKVPYGITEKEKDSRKFRRSIYAVQDIAEREELTCENIKCIRPGFGLSPSFYEKLVGKKARVRIGKGDAFKYGLYWVSENYQSR